MVSQVVATWLTASTALNCHENESPSWHLPCNRGGRSGSLAGDRTALSKQVNFIEAWTFFKIILAPWFILTKCCHVDLSKVRTEKKKPTTSPDEKILIKITLIQNLKRPELRLLSTQPHFLLGMLVGGKYRKIWKGGEARWQKNKKEREKKADKAMQRKWRER